MRGYCVVALLLAVLACALPAAARQTISLDGTWECAPGDPTQPPGEDAAWEPVAVPSLRQTPPEGPHCLWYRREFFVPAGWAGSRVFLMLDGVKYHHRAFVNDKLVGEHLGGFEPVEYDITDHLRFGAVNRLTIAVQDWTSLISPEARGQLPASGPAAVSEVRDGLLAPVGSREGEWGIWQSVSVEARPPVYLEDVFVTTSVREASLRIEVTVTNRGATSALVTLTARIARGGPGPRIPPAELTVPPRATRSAKLEASWPDARLWSPQDPHLYTLVVGLRSFALTDSREVRFGFREFWVEGDRFILNGTPIHLLATAAHPLTAYDGDPAAAYAAAKAAGCVAMRLHAQPWPDQWYRTADEVGMLLIWESALWCRSESYALGNEKFWENIRLHLASQVKHHRNHPSIIIWSAENEVLLCGGDRVQDTERRLGELAELMRELDPTRPVMFEGDGDPAGKADIVNLHYPHELARGDWPETAYWLEQPTELDNYPRLRFEWDRKKPLYVGEFLWLPPENAEVASALLGDQAYPDLATGRLLAKAKAWEHQVAAFRDANVSGMCPWTLWETGSFPNPGSEAHRRAYQKLAAFTREADDSVFAGGVVERTITVHNDTDRPRRLELRWRVTPEGGGWDASGSQPVSLRAGESTRVRVAIPLPPLPADLTRATYRVELQEAGATVFSESRPWRLFGREGLSGPVAGAPSEVAVYDPTGRVSELLGELGIRCYPLPADQPGRVLRFTPVVVIGEEAFGRPPRPAVGAGGELAALRHHVEAGGTLLVLAQSYYPASLLPLSLSQRRSSIVFLRRPEHPVLAGLEASDLSHWPPTGLVSDYEIVKPATGGFLALADTGGPDGLATAVLAELRLGRGRILLCQLSLVDHYGSTPGATRLLRNLLAYAGTAPSGRGVLGAVCDDRTEEVLAAIGVRHERIQGSLSHHNLDRYQAILITDLAQVKGAEGALQRYVRRGGRVVLHELSPASLPAATAAMGRGLVLGGPASSVKMVLPTGPAEGIPSCDLTWLRPPATPFALPSLAQVAAHVMMPGYRTIGPAATVEAEALPRTGSCQVEQWEEGAAIGMYSASELRLRLSLAAGSYLLTLRARGTPAAGEYPTATLRLDGEPLESIAIAAEEWDEFSALVQLPAGDHDLTISFDNDFYAPPEDRNLWIDRISWAPVSLALDGLRIHTRPGVLASLPEGRGLWVIDQVRWGAPDADQVKGRRYLAALLTNLGCEFSWPAGETIAAADMALKDCAAAHPQGDAVALYANGVLETEVEFREAGEYEFRVLAQGTAVDGVYPRLELRIDGNPVAGGEIPGPGWQVLSFRARVGEGRHLIGLAFTNDEWKPPQDRNVTVRSLAVLEAR